MLPDEDKALIARELARRLLEEVETKRLFKEALSEWLDARMLEFSKWTWRGLLLLLFAAFITFVMWTQGYHK